VTRDPRILMHMFAAEVLIQYNLLSLSVRTLNPEEPDLFFIPVYFTGDLNEQGRALPQMAGMMIKQVMQLVVRTWPYFNRTHGQDHGVVVPHDFRACFTFRVSKGGPGPLRRGPRTRAADVADRQCGECLNSVESRAVNSAVIVCVHFRGANS
jgi:hypothetical protein